MHTASGMGATITCRCNIEATTYLWPGNVWWEQTHTHTRASVLPLFLLSQHFIQSISVKLLLFLFPSLHTDSCQLELVGLFLGVLLTFCRWRCFLPSTVTLSYYFKWSCSIKSDMTREMYQTPGVWNSESKSFYSLDVFWITKKTFLCMKMSQKSILTLHLLFIFKSESWRCENCIRLLKSTEMRLNTL